MLNKICKTTNTFITVSLVLLCGLPLHAEKAPEVDMRNNVEFVSQGTDQLFPVVVIDSGVDYTHAGISHYLHHNKNTDPISISQTLISEDTFGFDFNEMDLKAFDNNYGYRPKFTGFESREENESLSQRLGKWGKSLLKNALEFAKVMIFVGAPGHGTHVSGIVLQQCAGHCSIVPLKVFGGEAIRLQSLADAIEYTQLRGYRLVNMSLGIDLKYYREGNEKELAQLERIHQLMKDSPNILFVVAAGNDGAHLSDDARRIYPAMYNLPNALKVGAVDFDGKLAPFSNFDPKYIDIFAPGVDILSSWNDGGYKTISGTSMSTPYITGIIAKLWASQPELSAIEMKKLFLQNSPVRTLEFRETDYTAPVILPQDTIVIGSTVK